MNLINDSIYSQIFFDEIDAVGGARFEDGAGGDNEVQRTMLELINQVSLTIFGRK